MTFRVFGVPPSPGSTLAFIPKEWTRPMFTSANLELRPKCQELAQTAMVTMRESGAKKAAHAGPVSIALTLYGEKPKSESESARHKTTKPDLDKLLRAILDALTGIAYEDDVQVCECRVVKVFGSPVRLEVQLRTLDEGVPKTPRIHRPHLFENTQPIVSEIGLSKTHDFGRAG